MNLSTSPFSTTPLTSPFLSSQGKVTMEQLLWQKLFWVSKLASIRSLTNKYSGWHLKMSWKEEIDIYKPTSFRIQNIGFCRGITGFCTLIFTMWCFSLDHRRCFLEKNVLCDNEDWWISVILHIANTYPSKCWGGMTHSKYIRNSTFCLCEIVLLATLMNSLVCFHPSNH